MPDDSMIPRPEYPRPQFVRDEWQCLNGTWQFERDAGDSGLERGLLDRELSGEIVVPFCPEAPLSGIGDPDFHEAVWYRRTVRVPPSWAGRRVLLHFQAVDHDATVWVDGVEAGRHRGGFTPFSCDLAAAADPGHTYTVVVRARDPRSGPQARGKQATTYEGHGAHYGRTTGIWQTVWCEPVPGAHLGRPRITPNVAASAFRITVPVSAARAGHQVQVTVSDQDGEVARARARADLDLAPEVWLPLPQDRVRLWSPEDPHLYDVRIDLLDGDGTVIDTAASYAGLRSVSIDGHAVLLNGEVRFQRLVLDQGYYPGGLMTAPSDEALRHDIELAVAAGFNGARLHQKVFEERYLYHADRMGFLVWGEFGDWGANTGGGPSWDNQRPTASFVTQWLEAVERDYSHPSVVGWCPLNETFQKLHDRITVLDDVTWGMYLATKAADPTRPVIDASGYAHRVPGADVYDSHCYEQDPEVFGKLMSGLADGTPYVNAGPDGSAWSVPYQGQPYFCSEFGGIWWNPDAPPEEQSWGYGERPASEEELQRRFAGLVGVLLDDPRMFGYCYTQLTDVYQEQNGIYRFDRSSKLDVARIRAAQLRLAAIERAGSEHGR
ncbi:glycoside hydrolase family 2 protein [Nonomuraea jabiensis]|uniref:Beta-galactosidase/beta-glucuronidase n=1 Tax=Nonomuraea jabiensis TaxID=882448 RepID=A0A7W9LFX2_9ACTN|nr:sugar-binding domain-containing protein [Nonomuraea jabiensis]MBB5782321.1 beta-galactosidase/beta-glucuronidase [Nonomuraea jabiensis]